MEKQKSKKEEKRTLIFFPDWTDVEAYIWHLHKIIIDSWFPWLKTKIFSLFVNINDANLNQIFISLPVSGPCSPLVSYEFTEYRPQKLWNKTTGIICLKTFIFFSTFFTFLLFSYFKTIYEPLDTLLCYSCVANKEACKSWKLGQVTQEQHRDTVKTGRDGVGKAKVHLEWKPIWQGSWQAARRTSTGTSSAKWTE